MESAPTVPASRPDHRPFRWILRPLWIVAVAVALLTPGNGFTGVAGPPGVDKLVHTLLFAPGGWLFASTPALAVAISGTLAGSTELGQLWIPGRDGDPLDFCADLLGMAVGLLLARRGFGS